MFNNCAEMKFGNRQGLFDIRHEKRFSFRYVLPMSIFSDYEQSTHTPIQQTNIISARENHQQKSCVMTFNQSVAEFL